MTCHTCGREHWCDDPGHTLVECEAIIAKLKADLAESHDRVRELSFWLTAARNDMAKREDQDVELINNIDAVLAGVMSQNIRHSINASFMNEGHGLSA